MTARRVACALWLLAALTSTSACRDANRSDVPVARVNGTPITLQEFENALREADLEEIAHRKDEGAREVREEVLRRLIEQRLLLNEARRLGIQVEEKEVNETVEKVRADYTEQTFGEMLEEKRLTFERWREEIREQLLIEKLVNQEVEQKIDVTEEEARRYYEQHPQMFQRPEEVRVRHIVLPDFRKAEQVRKQLLAGADFIRTAIESSISPDKTVGGDLGFFSRGQMPAEFDVTFSLKPGQISPIVKSVYGYHIFRVEAKRPPRTLSFKEVHDSIRSTIFQEKRDRAFAEWVGTLRARTSIWIDTTKVVQAK